MSFLLTAALALAASAIGTGLLRYYALSDQRLLDVPNQRSSHALPTPRGGGAALVTVTLIALIVHSFTQSEQWYLLLSVSGIVVVALVGWWDDRAGAPIKSRLLAHAFGALSLTPIALFPAPTPDWMGIAASLWWVFWGISSINVVNFMDGIDGLIGMQALIFGIHILGLSRGQDSAGLLGLVLAASALGFLIWNWAPAKIFLGDVGSGAAGLIMVLAGALVMRSHSVSLLIAFLPLYPMFLDALVTIIRRFARGERITHAHRSHLYQRLANGGWGHRRVSLIYAGSAAAGAIVGAWPDLPGRSIWVAVYAITTFVAGASLDRIAASEPVKGRSPSC
jgi:Fuc2NAc and GlcNAc transferase